MDQDQPKTKKVYVIDGTDFSTLAEFYDVVSCTLIPGAFWGRNLDAFNDILRGGFGTPEDGFILRWKNSQLSRIRLGHEETVRVLEERLLHCHPTNRELVTEKISDARQGVGETIFDTLVEIIHVHCPGGYEDGDSVELVLE